MTERNKLLLILAVLSMVLVPVSAQANLITNGGFETGDFTGWAVSGGNTCISVNDSTVGSIPCGQGVSVVGNPGNHSGGFAAWLGGQTSTSDHLLQTILATTAGLPYVIDFWLAVPSIAGFGATPNSFEVKWNGSTIAVLNDESGAYSEHSYLVYATGASSSLEFVSGNDPSFNVLDDVSVNAVPVNAVPEPASFALLGLGLAGLGFSLRKKA